MCIVVVVVVVVVVGVAVVVVVIMVVGVIVIGVVTIMQLRPVSSIGILEAELARAPAPSLAKKRKAIQMEIKEAMKKLNDAQAVAHKRRRIASADTRGNVASSDKGGGATSAPKHIYELEADLDELTQALTTNTQVLGAGKNGEGKWVARERGHTATGLAARCALAVLGARGKIPDPNHPKASEVAQGNCVHKTYDHDECLAKDRFSYCHDCFQPLCPRHRIFIAGAKVHGNIYIYIWHILNRLGFRSPMISMEFR